MKYIYMAGLLLAIIGVIVFFAIAAVSGENGGQLHSMIVVSCLCIGIGYAIKDCAQRLKR